MTNSDQISGSVTGGHVDINAAIEDALTKSDHGQSYKLEDVLFQTGFVGLTTSVVLSKTEDSFDFKPGCPFDASAVSDLNAWINMQPGGLPQLHVKGNVNAECDVKARFLHYDKKNPPNLVIEVLSIQPGIISPQKTFHYSQSEIWVDQIVIQVPTGDPIVIPNSDIQIVH